MQRIHLLEIADQRWCPARLRRYAGDAIAVVQRVTGAFDAVGPLLAHTLRRTGARRVVDLCAGSGGPWLRLLPGLVALDLIDQVLLTDRFPPTRDLGGGDGRLRAHGEGVDATAVPVELGELRTMFNALHHLRPAQVTAVLQAAVDDGVGIAVFEVVERRRSVLAFIVLVMPWLVVATAPFVRPFSAWRLALTWLVPVVPAVVLLDGVLSCLRAYRPEDLRELVDGVERDVGVQWSMGREPVGPLGGGVTWLVGVPVAREVRKAPAVHRC